MNLGLWYNDECDWDKEKYCIPYEEVIIQLKLQKCIYYRSLNKGKYSMKFVTYNMW